MWLLLLSSILSVAATKPDRVAPRIVGGTEIDAHSYPFLVRLYFEDGEGFCGGSLVSGQDDGGPGALFDYCDIGAAHHQESRACSSFDQARGPDLHA